MRSRRAGATRTSRLLVVVLMALGLVAAALPVSARPYGAIGRAGEVRYGSQADVQVRCVSEKDAAGDTRPLCFHWVAGGYHGATSDWVDATVDAFEDSWDRQVTQMGFLRPLADRGSSKGQGPNPRIDIYLANIDEDGRFGYCTDDRNADPDGDQRVPAYCVVDNDFQSMGDDEAARQLELRGTAAHEFFHAVQYAYDRSTPRWFSEGTAVWMEDQVFNEDNTEHRYLDITALREPEDPLDLSGATGYGSWLFWQFLSEQYAASSLRSMWSRVAGRTGSTSDVFRAIAGATDDTLGEVLASFGAATYAVDAPWSFEEGADYLAGVGGRRPPLDASHLLTATRSSTDATGASGVARTISAGPQSIHYVRVKADTAMTVDIKVGQPGSATRMKQAVVGFQSPTKFGADRTKTMSLEAGESLLLVLTNPSSASQALTYRVVAR